MVILSFNRHSAALIFAFSNKISELMMMVLFLSFVIISMFTISIRLH